jgi:hypothetical protein
MIVPSKNQKTYGVLHTENYFSFLGFCKKVNSEEIQKVDVYLDDVLIDTIIADKHLQKIEDIYELYGFGFSYNLPSKHIGTKGCISFKNHSTKENLQNSPYELINQNHLKFNEALFLNSLEQEINKKEIKDLPPPNNIGFLITEENLKDKVFTKFVYELSEIFPNYKIIAYSFNENYQELLQKEFPQSSNIIFTVLKDLKQLIGNIKIWIESIYVPKGKLFNYLTYHVENTLCFNIENNINISLKELSNIDRFKNHIYIKYPSFFYFKSGCNNLFEMLCNEMNITYDEYMLYKNFLFKHIEFNLNNKEANKLYTQRVNKLKDFINNKIQIK